MISPFSFDLLLGFLVKFLYRYVEFLYQDVVLINYATPGDRNDNDINYNVDKNKNPFKIPAIPKRKASELDRKPELPQQPELDDHEDDETGESLSDINHTLKQVRKARILDRRLPDDQKQSNHHLKDIKEEFSSYFDEESGNDLTTGLQQVEQMLMEEASIYRRDMLAQQQQREQQLREQQQLEKQRDNQFSEQNNPPLKKQKGADPLEDIPVEMPSYMDDLD